MKNAPAVSVLMPVFNAEPYLSAAIESILAQTFRDFEFLIIDDGSTDTSAETVRAFAARDPRIVFRSRENRGLPATLNELAGMARAPLLARMDADDISLPDRFEKQVAFLQANPTIALVGGQPLVCDEKMRPIHVMNVPKAHDTIDANHLRGCVSIMHPTVMMRAAALQESGGYDEGVAYVEDLDLWLRMAEIGKLSNLTDVVLKYRISSSSISGKNSTEQAQGAERVCKAAWSRRGLIDQQFHFGEWRPSQNRASRRDFALQWGWQAWRAGHRATARHYFFEAIKTDPFSRDAWKGLIFGTIKPSP